MAPLTPLLDRVRVPADMRDLSDPELAQLADEVRQETIHAVSQTGGHLGAGLGVVELTVALHAVFEAPRDKLVWDVGHQAYPHKILTGRRGRMTTLRQKGGLSGFTKRSESPFDPFGAAHSSTSISAALGFRIAADQSGDAGDVIAVIGDGAMSAGMAFEALNNAGQLGRRLFIILNDNGMSIAEPSGAMATYLASLASDRSGGAPGPTLFDQLGISYVGPVDGHDLDALLHVLRKAQAEATGPVLIHTLTRKGKGFPPAEAAADKGHGVSKFDPVTGKQAKAAASGPSYSTVFADTLADLADTDPKIAAVTAAMPDGTGLGRFMTRFPGRCFDVGIAEQHAVTFSAGLAAGGLRPFCAIYSTFLQRGYDQVVHDVAIQGLPVRFAIDRAGLVGADGATHAGAFDVGFLTNLPGFVVMAAADEAELARMVVTAAEHDVGPIAFRFPRGTGRGAVQPDALKPLAIGKGRIIRRGRGAAILSFGARLMDVEEAADMLNAEGIHPTIADARFAKPLDKELIDQLVQDHDVLLTVEEGVVGGFGSHVAHYLAEAGAFDTGLTFRSLALPDRFIDQASPDEMYADAGLDAGAISARLRALLS